MLLGVRLPVNNKEDERDTVITSALNLLNNKLEITACRLFRVDYTLLFSVSLDFVWVVVNGEIVDLWGCFFVFIYSAAAGGWRRKEECKW